MDNWFPALLALGELRTWWSSGTCSSTGGLSGSFVLVVVWFTFWLGFVTGTLTAVVLLCPSARQLISAVLQQCSRLLNPQADQDLQHRVHQRLQRYHLQ